MAFCPKCRFEYTTGVTKCPDCGSDLVESLPAGPPADVDFTPADLCTVTGAIAARLLQTELAAQGIPSRTRNPWPFDQSILRPPVPIGGGFDASVTIIVNRSDLARARTIYRDFESRALLSDADSPPENL